MLPAVPPVVQYTFPWMPPPHCIPTRGLHGGKKVYWVIGDHHYAVVIKRGAVGVSVHYEPFLPAALGQHDVLLFDALQDIPMPLVFAPLAISFCSPTARRMHEPAKGDRTTTLYMPVWSLEELQRFRLAVGKNVSEADVEERYARFSGKPRFVFKKATRADSMLAGQLASVTDSHMAVRICAGAAEAETDLNGLLTALHPCVNDASLCKVSWASEYVAENIVQLFTQAAEDDLRHFALFNVALRRCSGLDL